MTTPGTYYRYYNGTRERQQQLLQKQHNEMLSRIVEANKKSMQLGNHTRRSSLYAKP
jgi:hypothetical protein